MKLNFTVSTKPLVDGVNISIIDGNITRYYPKSGIVYISAGDGKLTIHHDGEYVSTSITFRGSCDDGSSAVYVDAALFKKLINTLSSDHVTFEFSQSSLVLHSGSAKYLLQQTAAEFTPNVISELTSDELDHSIPIDVNDWKQLKSNQLYAKSSNVRNMIYTLVYISDSGDALVCDMDNSLLTHSSISGIGETCMIPDGVVYMLASMQSGCLVKRDDKFIAASVTDAYECLASFAPIYESDDIGSYNADMIINLLQANNDSSMLAKVSDLKKAMNQASLLSTNKNYIIKCDFTSDAILFKTSTMECSIPVVNGPSEPFMLNFNPELLGKVIFHMPSDDISIRPTYNGDTIVGITCECGFLTVTLAACERV